MPRAAAIAIVVAALAGRAAAGPDPDPGDARFRAATARLGAGDPTAALAEFLAIADDLPDSPWADDALAEAARIVERTGDRARAAALLLRLADHYPASRSAKWARAHAGELLALATSGAWRAVEADHDAVIDAVGRPGDPTPHLARLEALLRAYPAYPRGGAARIWLGDAWGRQGEWSRALGWYRDAAATATSALDRRTARLRAAEALIAIDEFAAAEAAIADVAADREADPAAIARARAEVDRGRTRHRLRIAAWLVLAALAAIGLAQLRRATGSLRAAAGALARPPVEVWFLAPVAALVAAASSTGNPLVGSAVRWIALGGVVVTWVSGSVLGAAPARRRRRLALHVAAIAIGTAAIVYLAVSSDRLLDLVIETWRHGPDPR